MKMRQNDPFGRVAPSKNETDGDQLPRERIEGDGSAGPKARKDRNDGRSYEGTSGELLQELEDVGYAGVVEMANMGAGFGQLEQELPAFDLSKRAGLRARM